MSGKGKESPPPIKIGVGRNNFGYEGLTHLLPQESRMPNVAFIDSAKAISALNEKKWFSDIQSGLLGIKPRIDT